MIREILFRAAERTGLHLTLIANQLVRTPSSKLIRSIQVQSGFDVADKEIVARMEAGDLVITNDIPLASEVIKKSGHALSSRGEPFTENNIGTRLNMRASGVQTGGPLALN